MDFRAIVAAWIVGIAITAGALYLATIEQRNDREYARLETGVRVPLHEALPRAPSFEPLDIYPGDR